MKNGYDRYLDYQYSMGGGFFKALFDAIKLADIDNTAKLMLAFPEETDAFRLWTRVGVHTFALRVTPGFELLDKLCPEYDIRRCCGRVVEMNCKCGQNWTCGNCGTGGGAHPCNCSA